MKKLFYILILFLIFIFNGNLFSQSAIQEALKREAISHMNAGRYGEAIDLLNKYISANPRLAEPRNLLGLSHEARTEYEAAVLSFRRAIRLDPNVREYKDNLARVIAVWYALLRKKLKVTKEK